MYRILGLKLAKRDQWVSSKTGEVIDDGVNREITLCTSDNQEVTDHFYNSITARIHGKSWKIWKDYT